MKEYLRFAPVALIHNEKLLVNITADFATAETQCPVVCVSDYIEDFDYLKRQIRFASTASATVSSAITFPPSAALVLTIRSHS